MLLQVEENRDYCGDFSCTKQLNYKAEVMFALFIHIFVSLSIYPSLSLSSSGTNVSNLHVLIKDLAPLFPV